MAAVEEQPVDRLTRERGDLSLGVRARDIKDVWCCGGPIAGLRSFKVLMRPLHLARRVCSPAFTTLMVGVMEQAIVGFHLDHENHWVAQLACGHFQHVRHNPPWVQRPWVVTEQGRASMLGQRLECKKCDAGAPPDVRS